MYTKIRLLLLICPFISSFFFLQLSNVRSFLSHFYQELRAFKVETRYSCGQWVDVACILESDCCCFFISLFLHFSFSPILFFFFFVSFQLAKIKNLYLQNCFNIPLMAMFMLTICYISLNVHTQPCSGARCLIFGWTLCLLPSFICANSEGSGKTAPARLSLRWSSM